MFKTFVGGTGDLDALCKHALHWLELDPQGDHIALGGDLDGCDDLVEGFDGVQSWPKVAEALLNRGLTEENVMDIFWNNGIGVMEAAVCNHKK